MRKKRKKRCTTRSTSQPLTGGIIATVNEAIEFVKANGVFLHSVTVTFPRDIPPGTQEFISQAYQKEGWGSAYWLERKFVLTIKSAAKPEP